MLKRRTSRVLSSLLLSALAAGLIGTVFVGLCEPRIALTIAVSATAGAAGLCRALDEFGWLFVALAAIFSVLGNGLYALHMLGVSFDTIAIVASLLVGLVFLILGRALLAAGSADYPYDK